MTLLAMRFIDIPRDDHEAQTLSNTCDTLKLQGGVLLFKINSLREFFPLKGWLLVMTMICWSPLTNCCAPTATVVPPTTLCCPPLQVTPTNSALANGIMTFTYNNNVCRTSVVANCSQPATIPALNLLAGIVANQVSFLRIAPRTVTFPGTCNANLRWEMGTPPLVINSIQCVLSNLAGGG